MRQLAFALLFALACGGDPAAPGTSDTGSEPPPGPLVAGVASARIPAPISFSGVGDSPLGTGRPQSASPFVLYYPATTQLHLHPEAKAVVVSRGEGHEVIFLRVDAIGMVQQIRRAVVLEVAERTGRDIDDALIIGASHSHSAPGKIIDAEGFFGLIADGFFPEFYELYIDTLAGVVVAALDDARPARVATSAGYSGEAHVDRRCEDGGPDYENGTTPFLAIERDGQIDAVVAAYAVHGTVLAVDDLTLSQDVTGAMEQALEDRFDHPVEVLVMQSWAADMRPASGEVPVQEGATVPEDDLRLQQTAWTFATDLEAEVTGDLVWQDEPTVDLTVVRPPLDRDVLGYDDDEFPWEYGATYCRRESQEDCDASTTIDDQDMACLLKFQESEPAPNQTLLAAGQVGDLHLVTFPGEPGTRLAEGIIADIQSNHSDVGEVMFLGYAQDYTAYSIEEDDWYQGGEEVASLWGPRQGDYLAGVAVAAMDLFKGTASASDVPQADPIPPFDDPVYSPYEAEEALSVGEVQEQPAAQVGPLDRVSYAVAGTAPWLGNPVIALETADGEPVLRPNGVPYTADMAPFWMGLEVSPSYDDTLDPQPRTFVWSVSLPVRHPVPGTFDLAPGDYQLRMTFSDGSAHVSDVFTVGE